MGFGVPVIGSYGRFSQQKVLWSHLRSFTGRVPVASCFFQCLGQKEIDKIPSDWENSSKYTRSK